MNSIKLSRLRAKHIVIGLQIIILLIAASSWLLNRGNAYSKNFTVDDYLLAENAIIDGTLISMDDSSGSQGVFLSTPSLSLSKGVYQIQIDYAVNCPGNSVSVSSGLGSLEMKCPSLELDSTCYTQTMVLDISRSVDDAVIHVSFSGNGYIRISNIGIYETSSLYKKNFFYAFLLCVLINLGYFFLRSDIRIRKIILALAGIFGISCYPLYTDFLMAGHDILFHLIRIDAISQGLSLGTFPVKLHPLWANGYGYAVGIFYGDAFLYFPAFLRILGFSIQASYKFFVAFINLGTVLIGYYSFRKMFSDEKIALLGCLAYTLAPYRLMDVYTRAAVGEYCAMMVLPLILCGFYLVFQDSRKENWWKHSILIAFGLTGSIQSHVLSTLIVGLFIILTCLILIKRVFRKYVFRSLVTAAALAILLNLNFIVPFLDFYTEDIMVNSPEWSGAPRGSFQTGGLFPIQLFALFQKGTGSAWSTSAGIATEPTFGVGILMTIGLFVFIYLLCIHKKDCQKDRNYIPAILCALFGVLSLYMATCYFPWDALISINEGIEKIILTLQFPWRMLMPATILLVFVVCYSFHIGKKVWGNCQNYLLAGIFLLILSCGWYFYDFSFSGEPYRIYSTSELDTMQLCTCDYLPSGTDPNLIHANLVYANGVAPLEAYQQLGTAISCNVKAQSEDAYVDFPLLYYKYYRCTDADTSQALPVCAGTNNMVRVQFPKGYSGSISIRFVEPWFWRLAEIISALTLIGIIWGLPKLKKVH
ncbi:hypothetical protein [Acetatifactor aquisgranensis]|uniref:hypothetical protein n=1 Tax=Acetatifactor aquisgranensis TaxID=2941233 RepID=UPI00203F8EBA|nr:hypothetical protein [Acetatifactor aquisgranensis]